MDDEPSFRREVGPVVQVTATLGTSVCDLGRIDLVHRPNLLDAVANNDPTGFSPPPARRLR